MADEEINIPDIDPVDDIKSGDKLIVETENGTRLIDYDNFIIGLDNISFLSTLTGNTTDIATLSAEVYATNGLQVQSLSAVNSSIYSYFNHSIGIGDQLTTPFINTTEAKLSIVGSASASESLSAGECFVSAPSGFVIKDDNGVNWKLYISATGFLSATRA